MKWPSVLPPLSRQVCPVSPSCHRVAVPSMSRVAPACQSAACWPSGAERDISWSAAKKSTAMSGTANHSGATTCLPVKVSRFIRKIKQIFSFTLQLTYSCSQEFTATAFGMSYSIAVVGQALISHIWLCMKPCCSLHVKHRWWACRAPSHAPGTREPLFSKFTRVVWNGPLPDWREEIGQNFCCIQKAKKKSNIQHREDFLEQSGKV